MNPQTPQSNQPQNQPLFNAPYSDPFNTPTGQPAQTQPGETNGNSRKLSLALLILAALEFLVIIGLLIALSASPKAPQNTQIDNTKSRSQAPSAATSLGIQQTNDSISQELSKLVDQNDFPEGKFDDKALGL